MRILGLWMLSLRITKNTINFNHGSGKVTFVLAFKGEDITIESAYWRHLGMVEL
ncbi:MAG: hypothetical protein CM15mP86_14980 [Gammaproteobacteria bacterium]|nr:MAG: hypothetical protein CM15mP86_14980 [Gammaproteobacteria bacterium]